LADQLADESADQLVVWRADQLADQLADESADQLVVWKVDWLVDWLVVASVDSLVVASVDLKVDSRVGQMDASADWKVDQSASLLADPMDKTLALGLE